ncbi:putative ATP-dependent helicase Lhr [Candidatus Venteria ishoeyi]|uniref:Putative ATP-dependent helicase Lhr n=2 Tax=Candidatus Venteria ishoeyi TaxID=1899563 RepID=A0A1H6F7V7_9GAMM|nr:putative ATP-dependent helicase Lhr [Candidatus Venteria ishoeyi]
MFPVLDYCYRNLSRQGIKVIILYPMNALATDQAKRLAEAIFEDERLKGKVNAGLFIGEGKDAAKYPKSMGEKHIIENRESILASPPDILLTNFKMLDYGLMKSNYNDLWLGNYRDNSLLQFLVLDELHTYDGAQGTDVANLIRRLKLKLSIPENHLCPVGTSATIGSGKEAPELLSDYASKIFGETVPPDCIITENRISINDFFGDDSSLERFTPRIQVLKDVKPITGEGYDKYIARQITFWQMDKHTLANDLLHLKIVKDLVSVVSRDKGINIIESIVRGLSGTNENFNTIPQWDEQYDFNPKEATILSLFALISEAKVIDPNNGRKSPFLYTQTQLWVRELSGLLRVVNEKPKFAWKENIDQAGGDLGLPPWFCRDCGASGWLGIKHDNKERFEKDIQDVYTKFFANHKHIYFANRTSWYPQLEAAKTGYEASDTFHKYIYNKDLELFDQKEEGRTDITAFRKLDKRGYNDHVCPECNTRNTVSIIGTRIATLSSIAVSQTLSTDLDEQNEKQRKVLAFTNSVQDAAHQAGFVEARNYRFTFRSSLQRVVNELNKTVSLKELSDEFISHWKEHADETGKQPLDAYYYRFYPSDYIGKSSPRDYSENGKFEPHFIKEFDERISWEIFSEFGYNALIGRTLEKTASSAVHFDSDDLKKVWEIISPWLKDNEPSNTIDESSFTPFLNLVLHRIRTRGAISHNYLIKFREKALKLWDLNWMKDNRHFLNKKFHPRSRIPKLITYEKESRGLLDSTHAKNTNWFHQYYQQCFQMASPHVDIKNEFFQQVVSALKEVGILDAMNIDEQINFALNPAKIYVTNETQTYECNKCGHEVHVSKSNNELEGGICLNYRCEGQYETLSTNNQQPNYYQLVYNRNRSPRIYAADHTGLLERKQRELLEIDFKTRPKFNSKNAMVATSTLEMGIDIGSLNTAINNSIPPLPSNFLQRIGRAGRLTGSALVVNFAKSQAHDLFYYSDPMDMMAGEVSTPGCYIEAKEILKRHFFAFCIDSWTKENPKNHNIPVNLKYLRIETTDILSSDFFMNKILNFIKVNEDKLFNAFRDGYKKDGCDSVFEKLKYELNNDAFYHFHKQIFVKLKAEIASIQNIKKDIDVRIKELKLGKEDPERIELEKEKKNLGGIVMAIKKRNTLEHLTNVGALPNYAFPETGVTLSAKVLGNKAVASNKPPLNKDFEIVRSASQAIREFAPDNFFYSQGYKFLITGINTYDWSDKGNFHKKRFCSNCDHIEIADTAEKGNCPKCGHESWGASSNVHSYAKLLSVKSFNNQSDATLNDSGDDRDSIIYTIQRHFNFKKSISLGAFAMKEIPFGIEFIKDVSITEGNLGRKDVVNARKIKINEEEVPAHGFITCKHCGKSSSNIHQRNYKYHYAYCKHKDKEYEGSPDEVFEEVFFFREIQTEALKILLPVQELNSESELKMFRAGIELGLKKYFKGNPQHIRLADYSEYNHTTNKFDKYLVLFDSIPGGTGYLEKLFDAIEFSKLLKVAYEEIRDCSCQLVGKDGCYRCIYSYSNQYYQLDLSRSQAEKRFNDIYKRSEDWETQPNGLGNLTNIGNIEESELEERFIRSLKKLGTIDKKWELKEVNDDGTISYTLTYSDDNKKISFHIRPQVNLGQSDGIEFHTRTDFLMICTEFVVNNELIQDLYGIPRIAIYLDGYQYHASKEHNRFITDFQKRKSIVNSRNHFSWTLTWADIELFDAELNNNEVIEKGDFLAERLKIDSYTKTKSTILKAVRRESSSINSYTNNFSRLLESIKLLNDINILKKDISLYMSFFQKQLFNPSFAPEKVDEAINNANHDNYCIANKTLNGLIPASIVDENPLFNLNLAVNIDTSKIFGQYKLKHIEDINKDHWNTFWIIYNLLQFFELKEKAELVDEIKELSSNLNLAEIQGQFDSNYHPIIEKLYNCGQLKSEEDEIKLYSLTDNKGDVLAEAEFIIESLKKVVNPFSPEDKSVFTKYGFKEIGIEELKNIEL